MEEKLGSIRKSPTRMGPMQGVISFDVEQDKDNIKLSKRQKKVYDLLLTGKHSVTDITIALGYGDPRSYVRDLREKGIVVNDKWIEKPDIRYKVYWIESDKRSCEALAIGEILESKDFNKINYGR